MFKVKLLLFTSLLITVCSLTATLTTGIYPASSGTSKQTSYIFQFLITSLTSGSITTGSYLSVTFPTDYSLASLASGISGPGANDNCSTVPASTLTMTPSGRVFKITGAFLTATTDDFLLQFTMSGITNPNRVKTTGAFTMSLYSGGVMLLTDSTQSVTTTPGTLACSLVPTLTEVEASSPYTVTITPSTSIPSDGIIKMVFPTYWPNDQIKDNTVLNTVITCASLANTSASLSCTPSGQTVTVESLFSSAVNYQFQFQVSTLSNPISTEPIGPVTISSYDSTLSQIDQCSVLVTGVTAGTLAQVNFTTNLNSISTSTVGTLRITTSKILQVNDMLQVTFPPTFDMSQLVNSFMIISGVTKSAPIVSNISNVVTTTIPITSSLSSSVITFTFSNVTTPPSVSPTSSFVVSTIRNGYAVESATCCAYTATSGTLGATLTADSYLAGETAIYTFTLTTANKLSSTGEVEVLFPAEYTLASSTGTCSSATGTNVSTTPTCTIISPRTLTISNLFASSLSGGQTFSISAGSISNPSPALTSSVFQISTMYSSAGGYTDVSSSVKVTILPSVISSVTVSTSNSINNQPANYTFKINNTNALSSGSYLQIGIPSSVTVGALSCFLSVSTPLVCTLVSTNTVNVTNIVNSTVPVGNLASSPLTIVGLTNPISFQPTSSFSVSIYTSSFVIIQSLSTAITVTNNVSAPFTPATISPTVSSTGSSTVYTIALSTPYTMLNNSNLTLSFPSQLTVSTSPTCTSVTHLGTLDCSLTSSPLSMLLPLTTSTNTISLKVSSVTNPLSLATPTGIGVALYVGGYLSLYSSVTVGPFTDNSITYSVAQTSMYMEESTSLKITVATSNQVPPSRHLTAAGYLVITVPSEYTTTSMSCAAISGVSNPSCTISSGTVKITGTSYQTSITVNLNGVVNPTSSSSSPFSIRSYDSLDNDIDSSSANYQYGVPCTLPCRTCTATLTSCLSCYTSSTLQTAVSNRKYLTQSTCATACNTSSFSDSNSICYSCSSGCKTCSVSARNCTSCPTNLPYMLDTVCYSGCPYGYYSDSSLGVCSQCINNCKACTTDVICLSCQTGFYLNGTSCISNCPTRTYLENNVCINCSSNCGTCDSTGCLTCDSGYLLYSSVCYLACPPGVYVSGSLCTTCNASCQSCSISANNCSSCVSTGTLPYLYSGSCLASCPTGYYSNNFNCVLCVDPCLECTSLTGCTKCVTGKVMYNSSCTYVACPGNTIQVGSECFACTSPCLTCSVSQTFCITCIENYFLDNNACVVPCPSNLFGINGKCVSCAEPCLYCVTGDPYNCTSCIATYYLLGSVCYQTCPSGTYTSTTDSKCKTCATGCLTCTNSTNCTSCISGLYLYNYFCYETCPSVPVYYYAYQSMCLACQPQCTSCLATPVECVSCSSSTYLHNTVTKKCLTTCEAGYYQNITTCVPCQLPCKTCDTVFNSCASCYNGYFLDVGTCSSTCPYGYFATDVNNTCVSCYFPCLECNQYTCLKCDSTTSYYNGSCYSTCPSNVPYSINGYCTNCKLIQYCLECSSQKCTECVTPYLLYGGGCVKTCPTNYQSDVTNTSCIMTAEYLKYLNSIELDKRKNLPFPFIIVFICFSATLLVGKCQNKQIYYLGSIISFAGLMQFCSWILFLIFLIVYGSALTWLYYLVVGLLVVNLLFNFLNIIPVLKIFREDIRYQQWLKQRNATKQKIIIAASIITSFKFSRALFCRYFDLPAFSSRLLGVDKFYWWNRLTCTSFLFVQGLAIAVAVLAAYNEPIYYSKVFLASIQVLFFSVLEICVECADLRKDQKDFFKQPERDYLLGLSAKKIRGVSEYSAEEDVPKLGRTRSQMKLNPQSTQFQLHDDDYISVYDPNDYEEVPKMQNSRIPKGIEKGKFRKRNKKKLEDLWSIAQISSDDDSENSKKKMKDGKGPQGFFNNFIYWKPPKVEKVKVKPKDRPMQLKQKDHDAIFETIRNKESQFDILSQQEDLFIERNAQQTRQGRYQQFEPQQNSKYSIDVSMSEEPMIGQRTNPHSLTFMFDPDDLLNLNYAKKKHIQRETIQLPSSDSKRPFSRIGGMILKNLKK